MARWFTRPFLDGFREDAASGAFDGLDEDVETAIENGLRFALELARPLFGPNEIAEGFPLFPDPLINVNDPVPESATFEVPDEPYLFSLGLLDLSGRFGPFSELFSQVLNLNFDRDADDDDAEQVLNEILTGDSGATFDVERVPGIDGVDLLSLTPDSYTLSFDNGEAVDVITLQGPGIAAVLGRLDAPANLADTVNTLSLVDLGQETVQAGTGDANPIPGIADDEIDTQAELTALLDAAVNGSDAPVRLLSVEPDSFAVRVDNPDTGAFDLLVFEGPTAEAAIAAVDRGPVDPSNTVSELTIADVTGSGVVADGPDLDTYFGGPGLADLGPTVTEDELLNILATADQRPGIDAVDQGDTVRLEIPGEGDKRDVIAFATTEPVPAGTFDDDLFV